MRAMDRLRSLPGDPVERLRRIVEELNEFLGIGRKVWIMSLEDDVAEAGLKEK